MSYQEIRDLINNDPELSKILMLVNHEDEETFNQGVFLLECLLEEQPYLGVKILGDLQDLYNRHNPLVSSVRNAEVLIFTIVTRLLELNNPEVDAQLQVIESLEIGRVSALSPALSKLQRTQLLFKPHYESRKYGWRHKKVLVLPKWLSQSEHEALVVDHVTVPDIPRKYSAQSILMRVLQRLHPRSLSWKGVRLRKCKGVWTPANCCTENWTKLECLINQANALNLESIHHRNCLFRFRLQDIDWGQASSLVKICWSEPDFWLDNKQAVILSEDVSLPLRERVSALKINNLMILSEMEFPNLQTIQCTEYVNRLTKDTWKQFPKLESIDFTEAQLKDISRAPISSSFTTLSEQKIRTWLKFRKANLERNIGWMSAKFFAPFIHCFSAEEQALLFASDNNHNSWRHRSYHRPYNYYSPDFRWKRGLKSFYRLVKGETSGEVSNFIRVQFLLCRLRLTDPGKVYSCIGILKIFQQYYIEQPNTKSAIQQHFQKVFQSYRIRLSANSEDLAVIIFYLQQELWGKPQKNSIEIIGGREAIETALAQVEEYAPEILAGFIECLHPSKLFLIPLKYLSPEALNYLDGLPMSGVAFDIRELDTAEELSQYGIYPMVTKRQQSNPEEVTSWIEHQIRWPSRSTSRLLIRLLPQQYLTAYINKLNTAEDVLSPRLHCQQFLKILDENQQHLLIEHCIKLLKKSTSLATPDQLRFIRILGPYAQREHFRALLQIPMIESLWQDTSIVSLFNIEYALVQEKFFGVYSNTFITENDHRRLSIAQQIFLWSTDHYQINRRYKYHQEYIQKLHRSLSLQKLVQNQYNTQGLLYRGSLSPEICQLICDLQQAGIFIRFNPKNLGEWAVWTQSNEQGWLVIEQNLRHRAEIELYRWPVSMIEKAVAHFYPQVSNIKIHDCGLTTLPDLSGFGQLRKLFVYNNSLTDIPRQRLPSELTYISISNNAFTGLPSSIRQLPKLEKVYCRGINPAQDDPLSDILVL